MMINTHDFEISQECMYITYYFIVVIDIRWNGNPKMTSNPNI